MYLRAHSSLFKKTFFRVPGKTQDSRQEPVMIVLHVLLKDLRRKKCLKAKITNHRAAERSQVSLCKSFVSFLISLVHNRCEN